MKKALLVLLAMAAPAQAQCPPGMNAQSCQVWDFYTTPQQRRMDQGLSPTPPPNRAQQRLDADIRDLQDNMQRSIEQQNTLQRMLNERRR